MQYFSSLASTPGEFYPKLYFWCYTFFLNRFLKQNNLKTFSVQSKKERFLFDKLWLTPYREGQFVLTRKNNQLTLLKIVKSRIWPPLLREFYWFNFCTRSKVKVQKLKFPTSKEIRNKSFIFVIDIAVNINYSSAVLNFA